MASTSVVPLLVRRRARGHVKRHGTFSGKHDPGGGILARGEEYIPEIVDDPWANLQRVARVLGRSTDVHEYADPRRVAQELAEDVRQAYEHDALSDTLVRRLHDLIDSAY
jgi:hypothetical protein